MLLCLMFRTTIYLPEDVHASLKHLAVEKRQSMADLLRIAIERVYREDLKRWKTPKTP